jgi:large subunit ribosomal protein L23
MSILNIFKKPAEGKKIKEEKKIETAKVVKDIKDSKTVNVVKDAKVKKSTRISKEMSEILHSPHVTEKATILSEKNKYVFKVASETNKIEIRKAVEGIYGVDVESVRIINVLGKMRKRGKQTGWKKGYKKAIVEIRKDQKIEILPR